MHNYLVTTPAMPNSELYSLGILLGDWIGSEVVSIAASENDNVSL